MNELKKYQTSHPTFVHLWTMYIDRKKASYEKTLETCSNLVPKLENMNDKDIRAVLFLFYLQLLLK